MEVASRLIVSLFYSMAVDFILRSLILADSASMIVSLGAGLVLFVALVRREMRKRESITANR